MGLVSFKRGTSDRKDHAIRHRITNLGSMLVHVMSSATERSCVLLQDEKKPAAERPAPVAHVRRLRFIRGCYDLHVTLAVGSYGFTATLSRKSVA